MKKFFSQLGEYIPGFRSDMVWKKIIACIYYIIAILFMFFNFWLFLFLVTIPYLIFGIANIFNCRKYNIKVSKKPILIVGAIMIFSLIMFPISLVYCALHDLQADTPASTQLEESVDETSTEPTATPSPTSTTAPTSTPDTTQYEASTYIVGTTIPAGEYKIIAATDTQDTSYFELTKDDSGDICSLISSDTFKNFTYITLEDSQYFTVQNAYAILADAVTPYKLQDNKYVEGMYKVGYDIPTGKYEIIVDGETPAYVECTKDSNQKFGSMLWFEEYDDNTFITVEEDQYLTIKHCHIESSNN